MKLVRYGDIGAERPGLIDPEGVLRDLSDHVTDINASVLGDAAWPACGRWTQAPCLRSTGHRA
jgi:hypothetical protein